MEEHSPAKPEVASSSLAGSVTLISPTCGANRSRGLASGLRQKAGLSRPTVILDLWPGEIKVLNDVPQLPDPNGEGRSIRQESSPAFQVPEVR
jgi:hypothetical protein